MGGPQDPSRLGSAYHALASCLPKSQVKPREFLFGQARPCDASMRPLTPRATEGKCRPNRLLVSCSCVCLFACLSCFASSSVGLSVQLASCACCSRFGPCPRSLGPLGASFPRGGAVSGVSWARASALGRSVTANSRLRSCELRNRRIRSQAACCECQGLPASVRSSLMKSAVNNHSSVRPCLLRSNPEVRRATRSPRNHSFQQA